MKVTAWNTYSTQGTGRVVCSTQHDEAHVSIALNRAELFARDWNRTEARADMKVNFLTCNGFIRAL